MSWLLGPKLACLRKRAASARVIGAGGGVEVVPEPDELPPPPPQALSSNSADKQTTKPLASRETASDFTACPPCR
jgi:hypothetical protein